MRPACQGGSGGRGVAAPRAGAGGLSAHAVGWGELFGVGAAGAHRASLSSLAFGSGHEGPVERRLPCGARVVVLPTEPVGGLSHTRAPVALELWVLAGTAAEKKSEHGCAHLLEHMLFKPVDREGPTRAEGYRVADLASAIEGLGGDVNAFTSHDETCFHATVPACEVERGLEGLIRPVVSPQLDPEELRREIGVVLEEIAQYDDDPAARATSELLEDLHDGHPYGRPVLGRQQEVERHTVGRLRKFHAECYSASRCVLVVVGPVDVDAICAKAESLLKGLSRRGRSLRIESPPAPGAPRVRVRADDVHEAQIVLGWIAPPLTEPEGVALEVASVVLGHGEASRLATRTRRRDHLVTDAHASFYASRLGSSFLVSAYTTPGRVEAATRGLLDEIDALARIPLEDEELRRALAVLYSDLVYRRETVQGQAHALGYQISLAGRFEAERAYFEALESLDAEAIRKVCADVLAPRRAAASFVVPRSYKGAAGLQRAVSRRLAPASSSRAKTSSRRPKIRTTKDGISSVDLRCGLRVRAMVDRSVPMAAGWLSWAGGSRREATRDLGASALIASLLSRGNTTMDGEALAREVDGYAAVLEGFAGRNSMGMHFEGLSAHVPVLVRRLLECVTAPRFDPEELEEERRVALEELEGERDDAGALAHRTALSRLYRGHPFRLRRRGTPESLMRLTSKRLCALWHRNYPIGGATLGLAGDVDLQAIVDLVDAMAPMGETSAPPLAGGPPKYPSRPVTQRVRLAKEQAHVVLVHPGLTIGHDDTAALDVLTSILGGQVGRLFNVLREERGLVYHVSVSALEGLDAGHVTVYAATSQRKLPEALEAIDAEIERFLRDGVTRQEVERAVAWLVGQWEVGIQRRGRIASALAFDESYGLARGDFLRMPRRLESVRPKDVHRLAKTVLDPKRRVRAIVSA